VTHDFFAAVAGHVFMALTHREVLVSIFKGTVSEEWAVHHAKAWLDEEQASN
jgi:cytochrome b subunit of formate dehydrogenase